MSTVCELFFCPKFPNIPEKFDKKKSGNSKTFCFRSKHKNSQIFYVLYNVQQDYLSKEGASLVIIWGFPHFVFSKKNLWTLILLHNKET